MATGFGIDTFPGELTYAKLSQILAEAGFAMPAYEQNVESGGVSTRRQPLVSASRRIAVGLATKLFDYQFLGAVQNTAQWRHVFASALTATQSSGTLLMNSASTLTASAGMVYSTWRQFNFPGNGVVSIEIEQLITAAPLANQELNFGAYPHGAAATRPLDGAYFRFTSAGLIGIVNFNNVETPTGTLLAANALTANQMYSFKIDVSNEGVDFWVNHKLLATLTPAAANGTPFNWGALPISLQFLNVGTVTGAPVMQAKVAAVSVTQRDLATQKPWAEQQALGGLSAYYGSEGGTIGTAALLSNSLAVGAGAAMTNTTAALGSGLGGQFTALPTLAVPTDGIVQSYQNPVGTVTQPPRSIVILGVKVTGVVSVVLVGNATPVIYVLSIAYGHTAVSLATAETGTFVTATTKAPRRVPVGVMSFGAAAALGTVQTVEARFAAPIVVNPGEFEALCAKNIGVVTTTGAITFIVSYDAYLE